VGNASHPKNTSKTTRNTAGNKNWSRSIGKYHSQKHPADREELKFKFACALVSVASNRPLSVFLRSLSHAKFNLVGLNFER